MIVASFSGEEIVAATGGVLLAGSRKDRVGRVCTDSRVARKGDLFIALQGGNYDGHQFVEEALSLGVKGVLIEKSMGRKSLSIVRKLHPSRIKAGPLVVGVDDTTKAFQEIAAYHRRRFQIPVVAITGSNGKTTTKEMVFSTLRERWNVLKTEGNFNNRLGVPRTLLRLTKRHQIAVVEMGVDAEGQTTRLCEIVQPTHGVITNIGPDHLEYFGSIGGSARAKAELLAGLPNDGTIVLNADDQWYGFLKQQTRCLKKSFSMKAQSDVRGSDIQSNGAQTMFRVHLRGRKQSHRVSINVQGQHNVSNALSAVAMGQALGMSMKQIATGLAKFRPAAMRSQIKSIEGLTIIEDCYNANPASMKAALNLLKERGEGKRTIAVVGDMLELGKKAEALHREVGAHVSALSISYLIACGDLGREIAHGAKEHGMAASRIFRAEAVSQGAEYLKKIAHPGDVVLLKASRGMKLENILDSFSFKKNKLRSKTLPRKTH